jgi:stage II sporulation protein D
MIKPHPRPGKYFIGAFLALFFLVGKPPEFGEENQFFQGFLIRNPVIKISLGINLERLTIRASSGMKVYEVGADYRLLARDVDEIEVKGHKEKLTEKFLLQVAQTAGRVEAERLAARLRPDISRQVTVVSQHEAGADTLYQVRIGDFLTRTEALGFIKELNRLGIKEAWILREEVTEEKSHPIWVLVGDELKTLNQETVIYFIPTDQQSYLSYNGTQYRGIFVLRASPKGLVLVNILNLENYLKGVVPEEMSPDQFNSFEALKAQAVAARTYAIKNLGLNRDLGFDLCDTPKCQVYGGLSAEHPESSRAVEESKGEVAVYKGKLINALYTSTCGGMTEDVENVFEGQAQPYLKSTECTYEKQKEWALQARPLVSLLMDGRAIDHEAAILMALGVIPRETNPSFYREPVRPEEVSLWINQALALIGKSRDISLPQEITLDFPDLAKLMVTSFQWEDRVNNLMLPSEVEFVLRNFPPVKPETRGSLAYLIHSGIFPTSPEIGDETRAVTRGEMVYILSKAVRSYFDPQKKGRFRSLTKKREIEVEVDGESRIIPLSPDVFLFRTQDGETLPSSRLTLLGGEDICWIEKGGEARFLEVSYPADSATLDRGSPYSRWQVRLTRLELEKRINEYYPIGELQDIVVQARGKSRRVIELQIIGTESQVIVKGLKIRWVLGLRDILFTLDREYDEAGRVTHYLFSGRGWGHGVGLCQVGAFRMAQSGANYKEILKKYYRDIKITRQY